MATLPLIYGAKLAAARAAKKEEEDKNAGLYRSPAERIRPGASAAGALPPLPAPKAVFTKEPAGMLLPLPGGTQKAALPAGNNLAAPVLPAATKALPAESKAAAAGGIVLPKYADRETRLKAGATQKPDLSETGIKLPGGKLTKKELFGDPLSAAMNREILIKSANKAGPDYGIGKDGTMRAITQRNDYDNLYVTSRLAGGLGTSLLNIANTVGAVPSGLAKTTELPKAGDNSFYRPTRQWNEQKYAEGAARFVENSPMTKAIEAYEKASQELYEKTSKNPLVRIGGDISYNIGAMLPSVIVSAAVGGAGAPAALGQLISAGLISASSYSSALRKAKAEGASDTDAARYATLSAFVEGAGDILIGGAGGIGSGIIDGATKGALSNIASKIKNPALRAAGSYLLKNIIGEAVEGGLQEIGDVAARRATYDRDAQIDWKQVGTAAALEGAIGGIFGVSELPGVYNEAAAARIGAELNRSPQNVRALINEALDSRQALLPGGEGGSARLLAAEIDTKIKAGKDVSDAEVGRLYYLTASEKAGAVSDRIATETHEAANRGVVLPRADESTVAVTGRLAGVPDADVAAISRISEKLNRDVEFYRGDNIENGFYANGKIYINASSKNPVLATFAHELTHSVEGAEAYTGLRDYVISKLGDGIEAARDEIVQRYSRHGVQLAAEADVDAELVADYLQQHLLTDEKAITSLVKTDKTLGQRILDWIDRLMVKLTGTPEEKELLRVRELYAKALKQEGKAAEDNRYSISQEAADPDTPEGLRGKAKEEVDRTVKSLAGKLAKTLSVPYGDTRGYLVPAAEKLAAEYMESGELSPESINNIFEDAYERGRLSNEQYINENAELKAQLRGTAITLSQRDRADMGDYEAFRKRNFGVLKLVNKGGLPIDVFYNELAEMYPGMFPEDVVHPADQLELIAKTSSSLSRAEYNLNTYYGPDAANFKESARRDFEASLNEFIPRLKNVKRYVADLNVRAQRMESARKIGETATNENIPSRDKLIMLKKAYENLQQKRKAAAEVVRRNLLTEADNNEVERLLEGVITPDDVQSDNRAAILEVYEAKRALQFAEAPVKIYNAGRRAALLKQADDSIGDIMAWKDKKAGFAYARETFERNIRDIAPDAETAERMIKTYREPIMKNERSAVKYKNRLREEVRKLDISRRVLPGNRDSEAAAVQFIGEYESKLEQMKRRRGKDEFGKTFEDYEAELRDFKAANPKFDYDEIRRKVGRMRQIYDALHNRVNESRMLNGYAPVQYRKGYFPHFKDDAPDTFVAKLAKDIGIDVSGDTLPTTINGLTQDFKPGIRWASFVLERKGSETTYDVLQGFDRYIEVAADVIFHTADIQRLRALSAQIRLMTADEGLKTRAAKILADESLTPEEQHERIIALFKDGKYQLSNFVVDLDEYTNILAGKKSKLDRGVEAMLGRRFYKIAKSLESRVAANMVAINPGSWLTNFIPLHQASALVGYKYMLRGMQETLRAYKSGDFISDASAFLINRRGSDPLVKTLAGRVSEVLSGPMALIDSFASGTIVRARYYQNMAQGMDSDTALTEADGFAASVMAGRAKGDMPTIFAARNPIIKLFTQFQLEVNNELSYMFKDVPREQREKGVAALAMALLKYAVGAFLYNEWYEKLTGRRAAFDVLGMLKETGEDIAADIGSTQVLGNLGERVAQNLPFIGGVLGGGRLPIQTAIPDVGKTVSAVANYADKKITLPKAAAVIGKELVKPAAYLLPPFGGGQALKTAQGIAAVADKGVYTSDSEGNKKLQYPVISDNPLEAAMNYTKGALFGKTAFDSAKKWIREGFGSESAKTTNVYKQLVDSGHSGTEVNNTLMAIKEGEKTEDKIAALKGGKLGADAKAVIYRELLASEKEAKAIDALQSKGEDAGALWRTMLKLRTASKTKDKSEAFVKKEILEQATLSDDSKAYIYRQLLASDKESELIDYLGRNGADAVSSYKLAYSIYKAEKTADKYRAITKAKLNDEARIAAFNLTASDSAVEKFNIAKNYGVNVDTWMNIYIMLDSAGAGDNVSQAEIEKALKLMPISKEQKAAIWQLMNKSWKAESNPYSVTVGRAVTAALSGGNLLPALGGRPAGMPGGLMLPRAGK